MGYELLKPGAIVASLVFALIGVAVFPVVARNALGGVFLGVNAVGRYNLSIHGPAMPSVANAASSLGTKDKVAS